MRFLFLDVDGVLNGHETHPGSVYCGIRADCMAQLNRILAATDARIVISSAWRYLMFTDASSDPAMTCRGFEYLLNSHGLVAPKGVVLDCTLPDEVVPTRGLQITSWLCDRDYIERFVILDDAPEGMDFRPVEAHLVKTNGSVGLTAVEADEVIRRFTKE